MDSEIISGYKKILQNLALRFREDQLPTLVTHIEALADPCDDLIDRFKNGNPGIPGHYITVMRLLKLSLIERNKVLTFYERFTEVYKKLSKRVEVQEEEQELRKEMLEFLSRFDELSGAHDRLVLRILTLARLQLVELLGNNENPTDSFFRTPIHDMAELRLTLLELNDIIIECQKMQKVMFGLERMSELILGNTRDGYS
ncbi:MAG: hypothetical protein HS115_05565 [Spirochaetales bacterium]|nr:hypothetical protein [Spirochaetales bacterium]